MTGEIGVIISCAVLRLSVAYPPPHLAGWHLGRGGQWDKVEAALHYFRRRRTSSPLQVGDDVLIPITGSFQGMSGYVSTLITIWRDVFVVGKEVFTRIGLAAYPKHGLVHQVFFAAGDGEGGNHVPEIIQLVQGEAPFSLALGEFDLGTAVKYCTD